MPVVHKLWSLDHLWPEKSIYVACERSCTAPSINTLPGIKVTYLLINDDDDDVQGFNVHLKPD